MEKIENNVQTYPNQRMVQVHREHPTGNFLGIKNENWQAAARDLGPHASLLYLYLASNANGYKLALSPADIANTIGMPRSTYHDQFHKLVRKGYLVQVNGNTYNFFEKPQPRPATKEEKDKNTVSSAGLVDENAMTAGQGVSANRI